MPVAHMELRPLNACATLSERQRKKENSRAESSARLGSAFCERGSFVVTTKPEEYPSFKCGTAAIEWPRPPFFRVPCTHRMYTLQCVYRALSTEREREREREKERVRTNYVEGPSGAREGRTSGEKWIRAREMAEKRGSRKTS